MQDSRQYPTTPDGRYFVVRGRLWRTSNPALAPDVRQAWVDKLMEARRQVGVAKRAGAREAERSARAAVDEAKQALGERGPVWWTDGAPDFNRKMVANTPYADWYAVLSSSQPESGLSSKLRCDIVQRIKEFFRSKTDGLVQRNVCRRLGAEYLASHPGLKVGISRNVLSGLEPLRGMRIQPTGDTCGWYIWAGEYSDAHDFFVPLHAAHLAEWAPLAVKYLGLAPGWRFIATETYEDVWFDANLLDWHERNRWKR